MGTEQHPVFNRLLAFEQQSLEHRPQSQAGVGGDFWDGLVYRLNDYYLTSSIKEIEEIISPGEIIPVPGAKPWLLGLANIRGNLTTIVDLGGYLFGQRSPLKSSSRLLLSNLEGKPMAILVDEVFGQRHFANSQAAENAVDPSDWSDVGAFIEREFELEDRKWGVFSVSRLSKQETFLDGAA